MRRTLTFISIFALMISMLALPAAVAEEDDGNTCKDIDGFTENLEGNSSGDWGSIEFAPDAGPLVLVVNAGYEVTLCVKKGSSTQGAGPVVLEPFGPGTYTVDYPGSVSADGFSHYAFIYEMVDEPVEPEGILGVAKDAFGSYEQARSWSLDKSVLNAEGEWVKSAAFSGNPGDTFPIEWKVDAGLEIGDPENFVVTGTITVTWVGANYDIVVDVFDGIAGATAVDIDCAETGSATVTLRAPTDSVDCAYTISVAAQVDTNTATATPVEALLIEGERMGVDEPATVLPKVLLGPVDSDPLTTIEWVGSLTGDGEVELNDDRAEFFDDQDVFPATLLESETFLPTETLECPTDRSRYDADRMYELEVPNTATLIGKITNLESSADVTIICEWELVFEGDTVTSAGDAWSDVGATRRERTNTWFEYTVLDPEGQRVQTFDLIQGRQRNVVGEVTITLGRDGITTLDFEFPYDGWELADVGSNVKIQPLSAAPTSYLPPGQFAYHFDEEGSSFSVEVQTPDPVYGYAIHLDAGRWVEATY